MEVYICSLWNRPAFYVLNNGEPLSYILYDMRGYPEAVGTIKALISVGF
jgi:hypothetical protein